MADRKSLDDLEGKALDVTIENATPELPYIDPVKERALIRKIDLRLFPMIWVCYLMSYIDRTNIGNAKVGGMSHDLKMTSSDYSLVLSIFFIGYLLFEPPSNMLLSHARPSLYIPSIMVIWGAISVAPVGIHTTAGMAVFRLFLGLVEAGFWPGCMLVMSCWYKSDEMSKRTAFFYSASMVAGAFGGLLAGAIITGMEGMGGITGWRWLFIIEGIMTVTVALAAFTVLPDFPATTKWISGEERDLALNRLLVGGAGDGAGEDHAGHWASFKAACKDPRTWVFSLTYTFVQGAGTISYFIPTLMTVQGYKGSKAQYMTVPIYIVSLAFSLTGGWLADRTKQKAYVILGAATMSTLSFIVCGWAPGHKLKYAFLCFGCAGIWTTVPIFLSWSVIMFDGREKRGISFAFVNGIGNLASVYGSWLWPSWNGPNYPIGFGVTTALCFMIIVMVSFAKWRYGDTGVAKTS
ncbi:MFS transporter prlL [Vanrija pseudolonga]|uniref:MFS transporter prlL n=1 Tax=Vanrija pseudolonga TaxID=143232 RepID=A0AAF1BJV1_9TREE|nr:MFS transporter prlL [Vanrija pseudolonga]